MAESILPSGAGAIPPRWSPDHLRLHRSLLRQPDLLPSGAPLLLAVSGGQDSMAMVGLLCDLRSLHHWSLHLWHGDHGWRPESTRQASELEAWARARQLPIRVERHEPAGGPGNAEERARRWRYECLRREAQRLGCGHVLTAHTASDRAETVLMHLARGSHRRGLAALRRRAPLVAILEMPARAGLGAPSGRPDPMLPPDSDLLLQPRVDREMPIAGQRRGEPLQHSRPASPWLVRPLQIFCRRDTERLCRDHGWPVWHDPSNDQLELSRNRIRARVLPELEQLHPGAARRISDQAERLAAEQERQEELLDLALQPLATAPLQLDRRALVRLSPATQALLLQHWLQRLHGRQLQRRSLESLLPRLASERGPGRLDLAGGWQLVWRGTTLSLRMPDHPPSGHG